MSRLPGFGDNGPQFQFSSLTGKDRLDILQLGGDLNNQGAALIPANEFNLTALGADVDLDGSWNSLDFGLTEWKHVATSGRDQYVRIVFKGYMVPLGNRAVIIQIAEREFLEDPANPTEWSDAVLQLFTYVKILEPTKTFAALGQPFNANSWPFTQVTFKTLITPPLGNMPPLPNVPHDQAIQLYPAVGNTNDEVSWTILATDESGNEVHLETPLVFMYGQDVTSGYGNEFDPSSGGASALVAKSYNALAPYPYRTAMTDGERIRFAPPGPGANSPQGGTTHPTTSFTMEAATPLSDPTAPGAPTGSDAGELDFQNALQPTFFPALSSALVRLPAADGLSRGVFTDSAQAPTGGVNIQYYPNWVTDYGIADLLEPWSGNPGTVYVALSDYANNNNDPSKAPSLEFPGDTVGGIARPNINVTGLSAIAGLVSGPLDHYAQNASQDPSAYFPGLTGTSAPLLLGGLSLGGILEGFTNANGLPNIVNDLDSTTGIRTITYTMTSTTQYWPSENNAVFTPLGPDSGNPQSGTPGTMTLTAVVQVTPSGASTYTVTGTISPFLVNILGAGNALNFLLIPFNKCVFTAKTGSKPDIHVEIGQVQFQGALSFVNTLEQFLEDLGGSGFSVTVLPSEIKAGFSIGLPDIGIGIVDISNLGMSASVEVPFLGAPALATFSFASQESQFLVTVCCFGGSGYITLVLGLQEVQQVSASIEFAGNFSLDLYVASGGLTLTAGVYYNYANPPLPNPGVTLTGFVKLVGYLSVLGIISVSCELDLSLTYHEENGSSYVAGTATMSASVHIIFFTITIPITVHKQFAGSSNNTEQPQIARAHADKEQPHHVIGSPPPDAVNPVTFTQLIGQQDWANYCAAFAA